MNLMTVLKKQKLLNRFSISCLPKQIITEKKYELAYCKTNAHPLKIFLIDEYS